MAKPKLDKRTFFADLGYVQHPGQLEVHLASEPRRVVACGVLGQDRVRRDGGSRRRDAAERGLIDRLGGRPDL